uniref:Uncharacterized protein n=1 Tax=Cyanistes caeruleus TaxID=156563 RepID=A0A8C0ZGX5_CYACU
MVAPPPPWADLSSDLFLSVKNFLQIPNLYFPWCSLRLCPLVLLSAVYFSLCLFFPLISLRNFPHIVICGSHLCLIAVLFPELQVVCMVVSPVMFLSGILH